MANGFFVAAEIAIIASRQGRLEQLAEEGSHAAKLALELAHDPNRYLPTVQFGITLVSTFVAVFGGEELVDSAVRSKSNNLPSISSPHHAHSISLAIVVVICITFLSLLLGELVPKQLALRQAERLAQIVAPVLHWISIVVRPFVWLMGRASDAVLIVLRAHQAADPSVSLDDIEHMIETGTEEGVLESRSSSAWRWKRSAWANARCAMSCGPASIWMRST